jgi:lipopolysaccharide transport system ATP-binding protein
MQPILSARGLGKQYRLGSVIHSATTLREAMMAAVKRPFRGRRVTAEAADKAEENTFWALKDVSFDVEAGSVVGLIGRNGAGKSTLLKVLSRVTSPTTGRAVLRGRVGSLLEVGSGFHPELTGRENIFLNGTILGMTRREVTASFDAIVDFAEIEPFVDTPVKRYSSGMYVRLAFAVAAHLQPEILLVDEVLAVGDAAFQDRSLGKMEEVSRGGRTVLFVSHNMASIQRLCPRCLLLEGGELTADGSSAEVVSRYLRSVRTRHGDGRFAPASRAGTGWARVTDVRLSDTAGVPAIALPADADLVFDIDLEVIDRTQHSASLRGLVLELVLGTEDGAPLMSLMNVDDPKLDLPAAASATARVRVPAPTLIPGRYRLDVLLTIPFLEHVDEVYEAMVFEVLPPVAPWRPYEYHASRGHLLKRAVWSLGAGAGAPAPTALAGVPESPR